MGTDQGLIAIQLAGMKVLETQPLAVVHDWQWPFVEAMVRYAAAHVPFYAERLRPLLVDGHLDRARWNEVPTFGRLEAQAHNDALRSTWLPPGVGQVHGGETSGSTGVPLRYYLAAPAVLVNRLQIERLWDWHGVNLGGTLAEIQSFRTDERAQGTYRMKGWSLRDPDGLYAAFPVSREAGTQLDWLLELRPDYLMTLPTNARLLADAAGARGVKLGLRAIITVGEVLSAETRETIAAGLGGEAPAAVIDTYGCYEIGKLALQCPAGRYHACVETVLVEVLDDEGAPVGPGGEGWVVLTALQGHAMTLIRYRIGDRAVVGPAGTCPCGRTLPTLERILGRGRNMLVMPDGRMRWPSGNIALDIRAFVRFRQFQMIQDDPRHIRFRYVPEENAPEPDRAGLAAYAASTLHPEMLIEPEAVTAIERGPGGKYEEVISLVRR